jgi:hypothetical protein
MESLYEQLLKLTSKMHDEGQNVKNSEEVRSAWMKAVNLLDSAANIVEGL